MEAAGSSKQSAGAFLRGSEVPLAMSVALSELKFTTLGFRSYKNRHNGTYLAGSQG